MIGSSRELLKQRTAAVAVRQRSRDEIEEENDRRNLHSCRHRKEKSDLRSFVLLENPAPHNSLLMDAAAKLISTLLRKTNRARHAREKIPKNKGDIFMP